MDEKELTDEEIVKALENQANGYGAGIVGDLSTLTLDLIKRQKAEIERLTEENKELATNKKCETTIFNELCLTLGVVKAVEELEKQKKENAELQKQVDELTAFKTEAISMSLYGKGRKDGEEVGYRQAVKDTAKEILGLILAKEFEKGDYLTDDELHELFKERYGVEVE